MRDFINEWQRRPVPRRKLLSALLTVPIWKGLPLWASRIVQSKDPKVEEFDFTTLRSFLTSNDDFFVRNHFSHVSTNLAEWRLEVSGRVRSPFKISFPELRSLPSRSVAVTLECAGNPVGGGGVSTANWEGLPLRLLLRRAGLGPGVKQLRLVGADNGAVGGQHHTYARSIPIEKAMDPDTLLVYRMNHNPLPLEHGFPLRGLVPGWYAMDSVKWLVRVEALEDVDSDIFMTQWYVASRLGVVGTEKRRVAEMSVKSQISRPREGEFVPLKPYMVRGAAWAGCPVTGVELSVDGGKTWAPTVFEDSPRPYAWTRWSYGWNVKTPGQYTLAVRASDERRRAQPESRDPSRVDPYELNAYHRVRVTAR